MARINRPQSPSADELWQMRSMPKVNTRVGGVGCVALLVIGLLAFALLQLVHSVKPGHVGVVFDRAAHRVVAVAEPGWLLVVPFTQSVQDYPVTIQTYEMVQAGSEGRARGDDSVKVQSSEGQQLNLDVVIQYQVDKPRAADLYTDWGGADISVVEDRVVRQYVRSKVPEVAGSYGWEDIVSAKRAEVNHRISDDLAEEFDRRNLHLVSFSIREVHLPETLQQQLNSKIEAQQQAERKRYELEQAKIEAERVSKEAEGKAQATRIEAEGEAAALLARAKAQAEANHLLSESLTPSLLQAKQVERWDGKMPQLMPGGSTSTLLQLPQASGGQ
jgi:regulator of protease activity HflC (stomatin/prohibitin superfamily)